MIKDILVHVDSTYAGKRRLIYAFDLAELHHARLTGLHVRTPPEVPPTYKPSMVDRVGAAIEAQALQDAAESTHLFRLMAERRRVPTSWYSRVGEMSQHICELACAVDLVLVGQYEAQGEPIYHPFTLAESVVESCGRPVMALPAHTSMRRIHRALVAWTGRREAVRAVHEALPLLRRMGTEVEIVVTHGAASAGVLDRLVDHLKCHDVDARLRYGCPVTEGVSESILNGLHGTDFDLVVMGASGRPRWLEFLFGDDVSTVLQNIRTPVLISG